MKCSIDESGKYVLIIILLIIYKDVNLVLLAGEALSSPAFFVAAEGFLLYVSYSFFIIAAGVFLDGNGKSEVVQ